MANDNQNIRNINRFIILNFVFIFSCFVFDFDFFFFFGYHRQFSKGLEYTCIFQLGSRRRVSCHTNQRSVSHQPMLSIIPCSIYVATCVFIPNALQKKKPTISETGTFLWSAFSVELINTGHWFKGSTCNTVTQKQMILLFFWFI